MTESTQRHPDVVLWNWNNSHHELAAIQTIDRNAPSLAKLLEAARAKAEQKEAEIDRLVDERNVLRAEVAALQDQQRDIRAAREQHQENAEIGLAMVKAWCSQHGYALPDPPAEIPLEPTGAFPAVSPHHPFAEYVGRRVSVSLDDSAPFEGVFELDGDEEYFRLFLDQGQFSQPCGVEKISTIRTVEPTDAAPEVSDPPAATPAQDGSRTDG